MNRKSKRKSKRKSNRKSNRKSKRIFGGQSNGIVKVKEYLEDNQMES
jgi:hypothetical protein